MFIMAGLDARGLQSKLLIINANCLEQGSIDKPLTFDVGLIQLSFMPVC